MKLLFVTQVVDKNDAVLGTYHGWLAALAPHFEAIIVICLREGEHTLPGNVRVFSLGKEKGSVSRWRYSWRFLKIVWQQRRAYDAVFVHMNQEYILLAGWLWKLQGKKIYLWRNHYSGSLLTDIAAAFCTKVFCTSKLSYTAKYTKTVFMPIGIDTNVFAPNTNMPRTSHSILFLARMAPSKYAEVLVDALGILKNRGIEFSADFYGSPLPKDEAYYHSLKAKAEKVCITDKMHFYAGVPNTQTPDIYREHEIFVNTSRSGMFDKTIFEAAACAALPVASSRDWVTLVGPRLSFEEGSAESLAERLEELLKLSLEDKASLCESLRPIVLQNNLFTLIDKLVGNLKVEI